MVNQVNGVLVDSRGCTLHIQCDSKYTYIKDMFMSGNCFGGEIEENHLLDGVWILLTEKSLIKWSEE